MRELARNDAITLSSPLPFVLVTALDDRGRPNAIGVSWVSICSWKPWLFVVSVAPERYSHGCIQHSREFVINYPSEEQARAAWKCSTRSGAELDKFAEFGLQAVPARRVKPPRIDGSTACFECRLVDQHTAGDHTLFIGEVVAVSGDAHRARHLYCIHYSKLVSLDSEGQGDFELEFE
jgi:flavin reductase (DIM6/NTAB) family NADH-FMN oxidoreductase RutF